MSEVHEELGLAGGGAECHLLDDHISTPIDPQIRAQLTDLRRSRLKGRDDDRGTDPLAGKDRVEALVGPSVDEGASRRQTARHKAPLALFVWRALKAVAGHPGTDGVTMRQKPSAVRQRKRNWQVERRMAAARVPQLLCQAL